MNKVYLSLLISFSTLFCIGCSTIKTNVNKKAQVITLDDNSKKAPEQRKQTKVINKNNDELCRHMKQYKVNFPPQLVSYMEGALKNNKKIIEAQHDILMTNEQHNIQKAAFKPVIDSVSGISNRPTRYWKNVTPSDTTVSVETSYNTSLRARWNLFRGGGDIAKLKSTDKQIEAKWKEYDATVQDTLQQIAELYFNIVAKQAEIENIKSLIKARSESAKVAIQMNAAGAAKEADVAQAQAAHAESDAKLSVAEAQEQTYMAQLSELTGMPVSGKLQQPTEIFNTLVTEKDAFEVAKKFNPKVIAAQANYFAALAEMEEPNGSFLPSIDLESGFYAEQSNQASGIVGKGGSANTVNYLYRHNPAIGVSMTIPIYSGGSGSAKKRQSGEKLTKERVARERALLEVRTAIKQALEMIEAANENMVSAEKAIKARSMSLRATEEEHQAGTKIVKDVLDEQQKRYEALQIRNEAIKDKFINYCKLLNHLGMLNPKYLNLKGSNFDYKKEFEHQKRGVFTRFNERKNDKSSKSEYFSK